MSLSDSKNLLQTFQKRPELKNISALLSDLHGEDFSWCLGPSKKSSHPPLFSTTQNHLNVWCLEDETLQPSAEKFHNFVISYTGKDEPVDLFFLCFVQTGNAWMQMNFIELVGAFLKRTGRGWAQEFREKYQNSTCFIMMDDVKDLRTRAACLWQSVALLYPPNSHKSWIIPSLLTALSANQSLNFYLENAKECLDKTFPGDSAQNPIKLFGDKIKKEAKEFDVVAEKMLTKKKKKKSASSPWLPCKEGECFLCGGKTNYPLYQSFCFKCIWHLSRELKITSLFGKKVKMVIRDLDFRRSLYKSKSEFKLACRPSYPAKRKLCTYCKKSKHLPIVEDICALCVEKLKIAGYDCSKFNVIKEEVELKEESAQEVECPLSPSPTPNRRNQTGMMTADSFWFLIPLVEDMLTEISRDFNLSSTLDCMRLLLTVCKQTEIETALQDYIQRQGDFEPGQKELITTTNFLIAVFYLQKLTTCLLRHRENPYYRIFTGPPSMEHKIAEFTFQQRYRMITYADNFRNTYGQEHVRLRMLGIFLETTAYLDW